ncbi:MAG: 50S ribosomal protein L32 [bacterium]|nr:50S ribosomal protein L32 [bacterium]
MRHTRAHTANRRSHHALKTPNLSVCSNCQAPHLRHRVCPNCGNYKGVNKIDMTPKVTKKTVKK